MTPEEINRAIAEACGWRRENMPFERHGSRLDANPRSAGEAWWHNDKAGCQFLPPDYCSDLNAMHEIIQQIPDKAFSDALMRVIEDSPEWSKGAVEARYATAKASAAQKAEAFLKLRGLWKQ
jgi:hypothetical protein